MAGDAPHLILMDIVFEAGIYLTLVLSPSQCKQNSTQSAPPTRDDNMALGNPIPEQSASDKPKGKKGVEGIVNIEKPAVGGGRDNSKNCTKAL